MPFGQILPYYRPQHLVVREPTPQYQENPWLTAMRSLTTKLIAAKVRGMIEEGIKKRLLSQTLEAQTGQKIIEAAAKTTEEKAKTKRKRMDIEQKLALKGIIPSQQGAPSAFNIGDQSYAFNEKLFQKLNPFKPNTYEGLIAGKAAQGQIPAKKAEELIRRYHLRMYRQEHPNASIPKFKNLSDFNWWKVAQGKMNPLQAASTDILLETFKKRQGKKRTNPLVQHYYNLLDKGVPESEALQEYIKLKQGLKNKTSATTAGILEQWIENDTGKQTKPKKKSGLFDEFEQEMKAITQRPEGSW